jgi:hypothetical protein
VVERHRWHPPEFCADLNFQAIPQGVIDRAGCIIPDHLSMISEMEEMFPLDYSKLKEE